jgi:uncharacterized membrane protein
MRHYSNKIELVIDILIVAGLAYIPVAMLIIKYAYRKKNENP